MSNEVISILRSEVAEFVRVCAALPHVSDDEVGWRNEEVIDSLESCADGMVYFSHTGLRNYLQTMHSAALTPKLRYIVFVRCMSPEGGGRMEGEAEIMILRISLNRHLVSSWKR